LVNGKSGISPEMSIRLSKAFGSNPEVWLGMQLDYDLAPARRHESAIHAERAFRVSKRNVSRSSDGEKTRS
jgi:plasmid maintenance system antidote protein VapI